MSKFEMNLREQCIPEQFDLKKSDKFSREHQKQRDILNCLDLRITEILNVSNKKLLKEAKKNSDEDLTRIKINLKNIKRNINILAGLIGNPEIEIIKRSHFEDHLGNFESLLLLISKTFEKINQGDSMSEEGIRICDTQMERFANYFNFCVNDGIFLERELTTYLGYKKN